jgi:molybdopterin-containing oxidoreductase family iron-sulfur binding subunit
MSLGGAYRCQYSLDKADVVVCLDSDLLVTHPAAARHARDFAARRRVIDRSMPRLYAVEGVLSLTGANADHRLAVRSSEVASVAAAIAGKLADHGVQTLGMGGSPAALSADRQAFVTAIAADLAAAMEQGRHSVVVAGPRQPAAVHALCHAINFALGNVSQTVNFTADPDGDRA